MFYTKAKTLLALIAINVFKKHFSKSGADVLGELGSGAGRGGGAGGTVREAGGGLGRYGAAKEEEYFYKMKKEQLEDLHKAMERKKRMCKDRENVMKAEDIIQKNRKLIAALDKCFRKK